MPMNTVCAGLVAAIFAVAPRAQAATLPDGPYAAVAGGWSVISDHKLLVNDVPAEAKFRDGWGFTATGGYKWQNGFSTELEMSYRHNAIRDINADATPWTGNNRDISVMGDLVFDVPIRSRFTPYVGVGLGAAFVDWSGFHQLGDPAPVYGGTTARLAWQGFAGVAYSLERQWQLTLDFHYKGANRLTYASAVPGNAVTNYNLRDNTILVGVRYAFRRQ
jgi:opacity protein-like surface antigen